MNGNAASIAALLDGLVERLTTEGAALVVFPPAPYLEQVINRIRQAGIPMAVGAQNVHAEPKGAFTGEIAAEMVRDVGATHVLIGHSERRHVFGETDADTAAKFEASQRAGLVPVLCVGETLSEREAEAAMAVVTRQIEAVLARVGVAALARGVIAYEPVWAIGTGKTAAPADAQQMHAAIRQRIAAEDANLAEALSILYGGSVTADNAGALFGQSDVDGGLVGGASLDAEQFARIHAAAGYMSTGQRSIRVRQGPTEVDSDRDSAET